MPTEPNRKIEDVLKAYAQQRREQAGRPFEMHPATRHLLKAEVARASQNSTSTGASRFFVLTNLWPRLIIGGSCVALLVIGAGVWQRLNHHTELKMAMGQKSNLFFFSQSPSENEAQSETPRSSLEERLQRFQLGAEDPKTAPAVKANAGEIPITQTDESTLAKAPDEPLSSDAEQIQLALSLPTSQPALEAEMLSNSPRFQFGLPSQPAPTVRSVADHPTATEASRALSPAEKIVRSDSATHSPPQAAVSVKGSQPIASRPEAASAPQPRVDTAMAALRDSAAPGGSSTLYFKQMDSRTRYRQNLNSPPAPKVLTAFEIQPTGDKLRVVDADGSIYEGPMKVASEQAKESAMPAASPTTARPTLIRTDPPSSPAPSSASAAQKPASQSFSFRAVGTNRTLNQLVVFTGEFTPANSDAARRLSESQSSNPANLGRIEGQAAVAGKSQLRIEAQQVDR